LENFIQIVFLAITFEPKMLQSQPKAQKTWILA